MEIYKKCLFGKQKTVMFGIDKREMDIVLKALSNSKFYYYNDNNDKIFSKPKESIEEWLD